MKLSQNKKLLCLNDIENEALKQLPKRYGDYYKGGADDEITLRRNLESYKNLLIRPFCLRNVSNINTEITIKLGNQVFSFPYPIGISPSAFHRLAHDGGEKLTAKACHKAQVPVIFSTMGNISVFDIKKEIDGDSNLWFQLYVYKNREITKKLVDNAKAAGFKAIVLTVDTPVVGARRADIRNDFKLPDHLELANLKKISILEKENNSRLGTFELNKYSANFFDPSLTWEDVKWLVDYSKIPVIIKGILRGDDAEKAIESGAAAIMVSNHGGRQLDTTVSTIEALPEIVRSVQKRIPIFIDGGIRSGSDIFKAITLGADMAFIGRPILYGLTIGGESGVTHVLDILKKEFTTTMKLSGCDSIKFMKEAKNLVINSDFIPKL
ncbi:FMN-dependent dehydrogenase domain and Alpha-hydroxy acid dehydrogenase, FMN-dependent family and Aldolase-type TIM barrel domain-containing protein [Strongyloides ratti]|uniref:FMN-dependent dehydrogenase domain and Alpha-hydroxy acid dehydrogenase, FMN-dependent family and Aldolase-type TIM barrel domain-containing protein n=1 Tax=Strongyloides ratti TaxID=34506 RepID=A0A090LQC1_STRRB|nr:FMN-dependent dehydrogenase domain and Alpha-hydroxy acid dehydrogenase, FMN-dependent family and Aldolase-type TIM barrel domain-containing protein [Strongyloides ratti]CEF69746.1 FMN-dependent dehydrogenase domain and Alpha-hydroxy acid dehydrogenase, FMN-dependent family and Aldolase-type TIM barrel domain-containing protein [Strongyloides ratti]